MNTMHTHEQAVHSLTDLFLRYYQTQNHYLLMTVTDQFRGVHC